jgi:regulator of RNase E activity RraA
MSSNTDDLDGLFFSLYGGVVYDAIRHDIDYKLPFVVDMGVQAVSQAPDQPVLFGHAFTCAGRRVLQSTHVDDSVRLRMFRQFTPGCVQVIDTDGDDTCAHFGDISGKLARKFGCRGAIVDGNTRDLRLIRLDRFTLYCRGSQPIDAFGRWQIVEYQTDINLRGVEGAVRVSPDDYIFADSDGVMVIRKEIAEDVGRLARERLDRERKIRDKLSGFDDIQRMHEELGRW